jgi:hypothetical protein
LIILLTKNFSAFELNRKVFQKNSPERREIWIIQTREFVPNIEIKSLVFGTNPVVLANFPRRDTVPVHDASGDTFFGKYFLQDSTVMYDRALHLVELHAHGETFDIHYI